MKITIERAIIAALLIIAIVFVLKDCSRPSEEKAIEREKQHETEKAILKAEKADIQAKQDLSVKAYKDSLERFKSIVGAKDREIKVLSVSLTRLRTPRVDTLILDNPDLKSFVDTQTEIIQEQKVQIDTLKSALAFSAKVNSDLIVNEMVEDKIENQMMIEYERRIAEQGKELRIEKRKSKLGTILVPIVAVAAFVAGLVLN